MKIQSRLNNLTTSIARWTAQDGKQRVAATIVETIQTSGFKDVLANDGIAFVDSGDIFKDTRVNAQKLYRWLGHYDGVETNKEHLFDMEAVIVAAMPENIRVEYLNTVYSPANVGVSTLRCTESEIIDLTNVMAVMIKEDSDSHLAILHLSKSRDLRALDIAEKEVREAIAVKTATLEAIQSERELLKGAA